MMDKAISPITDSTFLAAALNEEWSVRQFVAGFTGGMYTCLRYLTSFSPRTDQRSLMAGLETLCKLIAACQQEIA